MTNYIPDDRRYMSHEQRAIDDFSYRGIIEPKSEGTVTCYCGKTVYRYDGRKVSDRCPRDCEAHRPCSPTTTHHRRITA